MRARKNLDVKATVEFDAIRVRINGLTHLFFERSKFVGMQTWIRSRTGQYFIELTCIGGVITCDYDDRTKWCAVLSELDSALSK